MAFSRDHLVRSLSAGSLLLTFACNAPGNVAPAKAAEAFQPMLNVRPVAVSLAKGATQAFQAEINTPQGMRFVRQPVGWRVVEPEGGTITGAGLYTAPATAGTYHLQVRREDFPEVTATVTVTVK